VWENLTIVLCLLGFVGALALMLVELPVVVAQGQRALRHRARPAPRHPAHPTQRPGYRAEDVVRSRRPR
jgi:hypothetical protein